MRPKIVLLTLVAAFGLLGLIAVIKGTAGKNTGDTGSQAPNSTANAGSTSNPPTANGQAGSGAIGNVAVSDEMRTAVISKEMEEIQQLQGEADGSNNPIIIAAILEKGTNPEAEVRKAAVEALRELNDTNAIPGLQKLVDTFQDPREKVAALDAIDYLKLPNIMPDNVPPGTYTNDFQVSKIPPDRMNEQFMKNAGVVKKQKHKAEQDASPSPPSGSQPP